MTNIGLVAYIYDEDYLKKIEAYMHLLQKQGKYVHLIGIIKNKQLPPYVIPKLSVDIIPNKMMSWCRIPRGNQVKNFQHKPFDLLIDLCFEHRKETLYLTATSSASLKVGAYEQHAEPYYDLMLSTGAHQKETLEQFTREVEEYLNQINPISHERSN